MTRPVTPFAPDVDRPDFFASVSRAMEPRFFTVIPAEATVGVVVTVGGIDVVVVVAVTGVESAPT